MIYIELVGGLGNQMFQYAMGKSFAMRNNDRLKMDVSFYADQIKRDYELCFFNIDEEFAAKDEVYPIRTNKRWKRYVLQGLRLILRGRILHRIVEQKFSYDSNVYDKKGDVYLRGFWQTEKYFINIADDIRREFTLKGELHQYGEKVLRKIETAGDNTVSLHIRRGDYISNESANKLMGVLPLSYYEEAINILEKKLDNFNVFVFSDDIDWVKYNLKLSSKYLRDVCFVDGGGRQDYEDMYLMSKCRHHIIANSTFSWWGAWLGEKDDSMIIAPKNWFKDKAKDASDIVPERWICI